MCTDQGHRGSTPLKVTCASKTCAGLACTINSQGAALPFQLVEVRSQHTKQAEGSFGPAGTVAAGGALLCPSLSRSVALARGPCLVWVLWDPDCTLGLHTASVLEGCATAAAQCDAVQYDAVQCNAVKALLYATLCSPAQEYYSEGQLKRFVITTLDQWTGLVLYQAAPPWRPFPTCCSNTMAALMMAVM